MITTAFINIAYTLLNGSLNLLPAGGDFPTAVHTAATSLGSYLGLLSPLVPLSTLGTVLSLVIGIELALYGFRTLKWLGSHIPFIGGKG